MRVSLVLAALSLAWGGIASADENGHWTGPAEIYAKICTYCHDAGVSPVILGRHLPAATTELIVRHGQNGMPAFRQSEFTDAELAALALWLQDSKPPAHIEKIP